MSALNKFTFISPGIFLSEIDESQNPIAPDAMGPIIIGRTTKGPAMRPVKVRSIQEYVDTFGAPHPGGSHDGDVWRDADFSGPTYAGYAAKAWLSAGSAPATIVRLLGEDSTNAATTTSGWATTKTGPSATPSNNGGAFGLFVIDSGSGTTHYTGSLAAIWYVENGGAIILSGATRSQDSAVTASQGVLIKSVTTADDSSAVANQFKAQLWYDGAKVQDFVFNFNHTGTADSKNIRKVFNTSPVVTNSSVVNSANVTEGKNRYWLGETFERHLADNTLTGVGAQWGVILPLASGAVGVTQDANWSDRKNSWVNAQTGWFFSQDMGLNTAHSAPNTTTKLFKFHALDYGSWANRNIKIAIEDLTAGTTATSPWGSFSIAVYSAHAYDGDEPLEKFSRCSLNPNSADYVAYKVGDKYLSWSDDNKVHTENGEFPNRSKYVRIEMNPDISHMLKKKHLPYGVTGPLRSVGFSYTAQSGAVSAIPIGHTSASYVLQPKTATPLFTSATWTRGFVTGGIAHSSFPLAVSNTNLSFVAGPDQDGYSRATITLTVAAEVGTSNSVTVVLATGGSVVATGHASATTDLSSATGAQVGTFHCTDVNNSTAAALAAFFNSHGELTATADSAIVTINQSVQGAAGNTVITLVDPGTVGMTKKDFTGGGVDPDNTAYAERPPIEVGQCVSASVGGFTGSWIFPASGKRNWSEDGPSSLGGDAYFGLSATQTKDLANFDMGYGDYMIGLPFDSQIAGRFDTLTGPPTGTEYSWVFSLDDISGSANDYYDTSGSRAQAAAADQSITAVNNDYKSVLDHVKQFWAPMYGGHDGLNVKESEPFRNTLLSGKTNLTDAHYNSIYRAIDMVADDEAVECNIMTAPGITNSVLTTKLMTACQDRGDALAIIDITDVFTPATENTESYSNRLGTVATAVSAMQERDINNSYGCCYYPWVQIKDMSVGGKPLWVPPSVVALGTFASSEASSELWFAPAGFNRGGLGGRKGSAGLVVTSVTERLTSKKRDDLYLNNINPIAKFPAEGIVIFGQKTLQQTSSALDRINVRRLMIYVKKEVSRIAATILFDQNVKTTWDRFTGEVEPLLAGIQARFGLTEFKVILDDTTTTPDLIDRNILYAKIFLKPARSIEFIAVDFIITRTGAAFED